MWKCVICTLIFVDFIINECWSVPLCYHIFKFQDQSQKLESLPNFKYWITVDLLWEESFRIHEKNGHCFGIWMRFYSHVCSQTVKWVAVSSNYGLLYSRLLKIRLLLPLIFFLSWNGLNIVWQKGLFDHCFPTRFSCSSWGLFCLLFALGATCRR